MGNVRDELLARQKKETERRNKEALLHHGMLEKAIEDGKKWTVTFKKEDNIKFPEKMKGFKSPMTFDSHEDAQRTLCALRDFNAINEGLSEISGINPLGEKVPF